MHETFDEQLHANFKAAEKIADLLNGLMDAVGAESTAIGRRTVIRFILNDAIAHRDELKKQWEEF